MLWRVLVYLCKKRCIFKCRNVLKSFRENVGMFWKLYASLWSKYFSQLQQALSMQVDHQPSGPEMVSRRRNTASDTTDQGSNHQASLQNVQKSLSISTLPSNPNHQVQMMPSLTRKKPSQWVYLHHLHYCQAHPHHYHCFQFVRPRDPISRVTIQDWKIQNWINKSATKHKNIKEQFNHKSKFKKVCYIFFYFNPKNIYPPSVNGFQLQLVSTASGAILFIQFL